MSIAASGNRSEGERQAMEVAEEARESSWENRSFCAELFAGRFSFNLFYPFPEQSAEDKKLGDERIQMVMDFLTKNHDPVTTDKTRELPEKIMKGLAELGMFGIKIPKEYGGLGLSQTNYNRIIHAISSYCASTAVLLSAHQSIGVPQPLKVFGTPEQKKKWLPRLAAGEISAFALTEKEVGSDPAQMTTTATPTEDGKHFIINGEKLWTTNGPIAKLLVVMAVTPPIKLPNGKEKKQITAFVVETSSPGFSVLHRCDFMGLKGIYNGLLKFENVKVPRENILWGEGKGLKLALTTLNTGRLTLPAATTAGARVCLVTGRTWAKNRKQWGASIGEHEATAWELVLTAGGTYALDAVSKLSSGLADRGSADIRIEASIAKLFSTGLSWRIIDNALQLRGGRGYETAASLRERGDDAYPIEQIMRDARINTIIEGTSTIQRLFVSREALDGHLQRAGDLINPKSSIGAKLKAFLKCAAFYPVWYLQQWLSWTCWPKYSWAGGWESCYLRFIDRMSHRLARRIFHALILNGPGLEKKQLLLGKIVDTGAHLFVMSAVLSRYLTRKKKGLLNNREEEMARFVLQSFKQAAMRSHSQIHIWPGKSPIVKMSKNIMNGDFSWLEEDICDIVGLTKKK